MKANTDVSGIAARRAKVTVLVGVSPLPSRYRRVAFVEHALPTLKDILAT